MPLPINLKLPEHFLEKEVRCGYANETSHGNYVIYAPHWSIPQVKNRFNLGTFMETGLAILEYAKSHKAVQWVFKPHPSLKGCLYQVMPRNVVDDYYNEWELLGQTCYTND